MYVCTYVLCNSAVFTKMPRLSDKGGGAIFLKGTSVLVWSLKPIIAAERVPAGGLGLPRSPLSPASDERSLHLVFLFCFFVSHPKVHLDVFWVSMLIFSLIIA